MTLPCVTDQADTTKTEPILVKPTLRNAEALTRQLPFQQHLQPPCGTGGPSAAGFEMDAKEMNP